MHDKPIFPAARPRASRRRTLAALGAGALTAVLAAGCSSPGSQSAAAGGGTPSSGAAASSCVSAATARATAAMAPMALATINQVNASAMKGKTFAVIALTSVPSTQEESVAMQQALAMAGAKLLIFSGQGLPDVITQDFQSAVTQHAAGIVTLGINPAVFPAAYAVSKAANIPVVAASTGEPQAPLTDGVGSLVTVDSAQIGALQADYALEHTGCKLHAAVIYTSASKNTLDQLNAVTAEVKSLCPASCSVDPVPGDIATFPTTMSGQVQTTLQHSPDINFLISTSDSFVPYVIQGRNALSSTVPVIGCTGTALDKAIAGDGETADVEWPPNTVLGYYFAGAVMSAAAGTPKSQTLPVRLVDSTNWGTSAADSAQYPELTGYQAAFKKAWGL